MTVIQGVAVDITALFRSSLSNVRARNKEIGEPNGLTNILPSKKGPFFTNANEVLKNISSHYKLLLEHKRNYLKDENASFSETDKIYLEKIIIQNLQTIDTKIKWLETETKEITTNDGNSQASECRLNALSILKKNYQILYKLFKNMKDSRLRKQKEKDMLLSLHRPSSNKSSSKFVLPNKSTKNQKQDDEENTAVSFIEEKTYSFMDREVENVLSELTVEESQMLEEENTHLHQELLSNRDEIKQITSQVVELSKMQDMLTENVDVQGQQIEDIHDTVLGATDNVQRGNEEIREAMRKDAAFRVWIMFILIVMSSAILFLDWYNP